MKIFFARHGESQANLRHEISNRGLKYGLTTKGREQALALALKLEKKQISRIFTSPVLRAIETTVIIANRLNVDYEVAEHLREFDCGIAEGRSDPEAWAMWKSLFEAWTERQECDRRIEGGESFNDIRQRFVPFIDEIIRTYRNTPENIMLVAHGGLFWTMLPVILSNVNYGFMEGHSFDYTTFIETDLKPEGLTCTYWNGSPVS